MFTSRDLNCLSIFFYCVATIIFLLTNMAFEVRGLELFGNFATQFISGFGTILQYLAFIILVFSFLKRLVTKQWDKLFFVNVFVSLGFIIVANFITQTFIIPSLKLRSSFD